MTQVKPTEFNVHFCPFCGAGYDELAFSQRYDPIIRREVTDGHCDKCERGFVVILIEAEEKTHD